MNQKMFTNINLLENETCSSLTPTMFTVMSHAFTHSSAMIAVTLAVLLLSS